MPSRRASRLLPPEYGTLSLKDGLYASLSDHLATDEDAAAFAPYAHDPVGFVRNVLGAHPWSRQEEILRAVAGHPQVTVRSGHGVGKTFTAACTALWFLHCYKPSLVLTTAPTKRQVETLLWKEIGILWRKARVPLPGRCLATKAEAGLEQHAYGFTADNPEGAAGAHSPNVLCILDEASGVPGALLETLHGALTSANTHLLLIGNPTRPAGPFYDSHRSPEWCKFVLSCLDNPNFAVGPHDPIPCPWLTTREWVERRKADWGEDSIPYLVRVLGQFPPTGDTALFTLARCEEAQEVPAGEPTPKVLGIDVARFGECETAVAVRHGNTLVDLVAWQGYDTVQSKGRIYELIDAHRPTQLVIDAVGLGAGLVDQLTAELTRVDPATLPPHRRGIQVIGFISQRAAHNPAEFHSRRDEAYWRLSALLRDKTIRFAAEFPRLTQQLTEIRYHYSARGQVVIETKDEMRRRKVPSPDQADAVALAFSEVARLPNRPVARGSVRPAR